MFYVSTHQRSCNFCLESSIQRLKESLVTWSNNNHLKLDNNKIWSCGGLGCFNMDNSTQDIKKVSCLWKIHKFWKKGVLDLLTLNYWPIKFNHAKVSQSEHVCKIGRSGTHIQQTKNIMALVMAIGGAKASLVYFWPLRWQLTTQYHI